MMNGGTEKRLIGGSFMEKKKRNENLRQYHLAHPEMTHAKLARIFKISRVRVTQILNNKPKEERNAVQ